MSGRWPGPVTVRIGNRAMVTHCVVGPPLSEPLIGQVVLETLDLIADCTNRTLTPWYPDYPLLKAEGGPRWPRGVDRRDRERIDRTPLRRRRGHPDQENQAPRPELE